MSLILKQSASGHRAGTDAVLLAASLPEGKMRIADLGAATGAVGLRAAQMAPDAEVALIERDALCLELARENIALNGLGARVEAIAADVTQLGGMVKFRERFDCVLTNPPFYDEFSVRPSPDRAKAQAHVMPGDPVTAEAATGGSTGLDRWIKSVAAILQPRGTLVMIHRAEALHEILVAIRPRLGGLALRFVHPSAEKPAIRVIVTAKKGSRAPLSILPSLVLHGPEGRFTPDVSAIHAGISRLFA